MAKKKHVAGMKPERLAEEELAESMTPKNKTAHSNKKPAEIKAFDSGSKIMIAFIVIIVAALVVIFGLRAVYTPKVLTLDDIFQKTYKGDQSENNYLYNGVAFVKSEGLWYADIQKQGTNQVFRISLHYGPKELQNVYLSGNPKIFNAYLSETKDPKDPNQTAIYITFDPDSPDLSYVAVASGELSLNLARALNVMPIAACTHDENEACAGRPIKNCEYDQEAMIYLTYEQNKTDVRVANNCIVVNGKSDLDILKATDRLLYTFYGIMPVDEKQAYVSLYAKKNANSISVEPGFYDGIGLCAWLPGELEINVLNGDKNTIATRRLNITDNDKFLEYCTTKQPIVISLPAEQLAEAKWINASFTNMRAATIGVQKLAEIKSN